MIMLWALVFAIGTPQVITVPGISDHEACIKLKDAIQTEMKIKRKWACYEYPSIISSGDSNGIKSY